MVTVKVEDLPNGMDIITEQLKYSEHIKSENKYAAAEKGIEQILEEGLDGSNLREGTAYKVVLVFLEAEAEKFDKNARISLENFQTDARKVLRAGDNEIGIRLKVGNNKAISFKAKLKNIKKVSTLDRFVNFYVNEIDINERTGISTKGNLITSFQRDIDKKYGTNNVKIALKNNNKTEKNKKLKVGSNEIDIVLSTKTEKREACA